MHGGTARVVYDSHELFVTSGAVVGRPSWAVAWLARRELEWAAQADALVTVSEGYAAELGPRLGKDEIVVVHNCPPRPVGELVRSDAIREAAGIPAAAPIVLYHGGLRPGRGLEQLAEAMLEPGLEGAHLAFLGFGPSRGEVEALAAEPRFGGRLHVLGPVPPLDVVSWVASVDVAAMPIQAHSQSYYLSTPNKMFEAFAAGVPVVASDFPGMRGIVAEDPDRPARRAVRPGRPGVDRSRDPEDRRAVARRVGGARGALPPGRDRALELGDGIGAAGRALPAPRAGRMTEAAAAAGAVPQRATIVLPSSGAFDSRTWRIASALAARGHAVTVLARREAGLPDDEAHPSGYRIVRVPVSAEAGLPGPLRWVARRVRRRPTAPGQADGAGSGGRPATWEPAGRIRSAWSAAVRLGRDRAHGSLPAPRDPRGRAAGDLVHGMAYMGIPSALDLGRRDGAAGRLRRARHLRRRREPRPAAAVLRAGLFAARRAALGAPSEPGRHGQPSRTPTSWSAGSASRCRSSS